MGMTLEKAYMEELPFVFANYCTEDADRVAPILKVLQGNGGRIWHKEDGAEVGNRLKECEAALAFISQNALESHDWRKEFNTLVLEKKTVVAVILDEVKFTLVMNMQMADMQVVSYTEYKTAGAFCVKILQVPAVKKCLEEEKTFKIPKAFAKKYYLKRKSTSELIHISKEEFTIGRKIICDFVIPDNITISRVHAIFELENGVCTVKDNNSTNFVFVNDVQLEPEVKCQIKSGDVIEIGNEKFIVEVVE